MYQVIAERKESPMTTATTKSQITSDEMYLLVNTSWITCGNKYYNNGTPEYFDYIGVPYEDEGIIIESLVEKGVLA